jgi:ABC-type nickel/cobalt efflux system permease component RcnA
MQLLKFLVISATATNAFILLGFLTRLIPGLGLIAWGVVFVSILFCIIFAVQDTENRIYFILSTLGIVFGMFLAFRDFIEVAIRFNAAELTALGLGILAMFVIGVVGVLHVFISK